MPGFNGTNCENNIDDCPGHQCANGGTCMDGVNTYNCQCPPEWTGKGFVCVVVLFNRTTIRLPVWPPFIWFHCAASLILCVFTFPFLSPFLIMKLNLHVSCSIFLRLTLHTRCVSADTLVWHTQAFRLQSKHAYISFLGPVWVYVALIQPGEATAMWGLSRVSKNGHCGLCSYTVHFQCPLKIKLSR